MLTHILILLFVYIGTANKAAAGAEILLRDSALPLWKFQGFSLAHGGKPYAQHALDGRHDSAKSLDIETEIARLKNWQTVGKDAEVFTGCSKVTSWRYDFDWPATERELLSWCLRTMASSVTLEAQNSSLNQEARIFSGRVKPSDLVNVELHPSISGNYEILLVNGREIKITTSKIKVPNVKARITLLSSSHYPITEYIDGGQLKNMKLSASPLLMGSCDDGYTLSPYQFSTDGTLKALGPDCEFVLKKSTAVESAVPIVKTSPSAKETNSFWKSNWVWIGLGSALIYHLANQNSEGAPAQAPSTQQGF